MKLLLRTGLVILMFAQTSCVTYYQEPEGPSAKFRMNIDPDFDGVSQDYQISMTEEMLDHIYIVPVLSKNSWVGKNPLTVEKRIPAGRRVFFLVSSGWAAGGTQYTTMTNYCSGTMSFVPQLDHTYVAVHHTPSCELEIIDEQTGAAPPDARRYVPRLAG